MSTVVVIIVTILTEVVIIFGANTIECEDQAHCQCPQNDTCIVSCVGQSDCRCSTIKCPLQYPCYIQCEGGNSCHATNFQCSSNNELCQISCGGFNSCDNAHVNCPLNSNNECINTTLTLRTKSTSITISDKNVNNCTLSTTTSSESVLPSEYIGCDYVFQCGGGGSCNDTTFNCPSRRNCYVNCGGGWSCRNATTNCPSNHDCNMTCGGGWSCKYTTINCASDYDCYVRCGGGYSCNYTTINCPTNNDKHCFITCGGGSSCEHLHINSINTTNIVVIRDCDDINSNCEIGSIAIPQTPYFTSNECTSTWTISSSTILVGSLVLIILVVILVFIIGKTRKSKTESNGHLLQLKNSNNKTQYTVQKEGELS